MDKYECTVCGYIYDPAAGDPDAGVKPGTPLKNCRKAGFALCAARQKTSL